VSPFVHFRRSRAGLWNTAPDLPFSRLGVLGATYQWRVTSLRRLIERYDVEVRSLEGMIRAQWRGHAGYRAIPAIHGIGPTVAAILVAELGDVSRFDSAAALCSWGLTPKHRQSDTKVVQGAITKQGSRLVRWALIEATSRYHAGPVLSAKYRAIGERRGINTARVAIARNVLTLVYHGLRDGEIRCLQTPATAA
jgi:transposase